MILNLIFSCFFLLSHTFIHIQNNNINKKKLNTKFEIICRLFCLEIFTFVSSGIMVKVSANGLGDWGLIPGQVILKTQKNGTWYLKPFKCVQKRAQTCLRMLSTKCVYKSYKHTHTHTIYIIHIYTHTHCIYVRQKKYTQWRKPFFVL